MADEETDEERAARRLKVLQGRFDGKTYPQLADELNISVGQAHADYQRAIEEQPITNVEEYKKLELARLEWGLNTARDLVIRLRDEGEFSKAASALSQYFTAERGIRILVGADAPMRQEITVLTDELLEVKLRELEEEEVRRQALLENSVETTLGGQSQLAS